MTCLALTPTARDLYDPINTNHHLPMVRGAHECGWEIAGCHIRQPARHRRAERAGLIAPAPSEMSILDSDKEDNLCAQPLHCAGGASVATLHNYALTKTPCLYTFALKDHGLCGSFANQTKGILAKLTTSNIKSDLTWITLSRRTEVGQPDLPETPRANGGLPVRVVR